MPLCLEDLKIVYKVLQSRLVFNLRFWYKIFLVKSVFSFFLSFNNRCPRNGRSINSRRNFKEHLRTHTGERPYQCSFMSCGAQFACQKSFKNHVQFVHFVDRLNESGNAFGSAYGG